MSTFESLGLTPKTLRALNELNFTTPTPIQEQAIPQLLAGNIDMLGLAQTGTGKTAAFALPILEKIDGSIKKPQALIICPTRELCMQITKDIEKFSQFTPEIRTVAVYGGASISMQIRDLRRGVQIVVATAGRLQDIIDRGEINFDHTKIVVLDEADEMLNMGFKEAITQILSNTPDEKNTWLFTATMPREIKTITKKYMTNPVEVSVSVNKGNENIEHEYYIVSPRERYLALKRIVDFYPDIFGIVFCRTKNETKEVADMLIKDGYNSDSLHGDLTQQQRDIVMNRYREKSLQLLIATDVAARGIDVSDVTHVINYALPDEIENYTHRSGRTARAGKKGISISLIMKREVGKISELERIIDKKFNRVNIPSGLEICEKQLLALIHRAHEVEINEEQIAPFMDKINAEFESLTKEEIIKRFASMEFNRFLEYYKNAPDLNVKEYGERRERDSRDRGDSRDSRVRSRDTSFGDRRERGERSGSGAQAGFTRFFINIGTLDRMNKGDVLRMVCDTTDVRGVNIGRIDMKDKFSFFEVENQFKSNITDKMRNLEIEGRAIRVNEAESSGDAGAGFKRSDAAPRKFDNNRTGGAPRSFDRSDRGERKDFGRDRDFSKPSAKSSKPAFQSNNKGKDDKVKFDFNFKDSF